MDRAAFWELIATINHSALRNGDEQGAVEPLIQELATYDESEIRLFEDHLAQVLYDLDGQTYANEAGPSGQSGDAFLYARCFVVAHGKKHYHAVKADPKKMPKSLDQWCEFLLYVAQRSWSEVTGRDEEAWGHAPPVSYETGSNKSLWK